MNFDDHAAELAAMFRSTNRVRFDAAPDEAARRWWIDNIYGRYGLSPEDVGDRLSRSWAGDRTITITEFDGAARRFGFRVDGQWANGSFWLHERVLDMAGSVLNAERMLVDERRSQSGLGRRFMRDAVELARVIGLERVRLDAQWIGRYVWLRIGFVPDRGSWLTLQSSIRSRLAAAFPDLGPARFAAVMEIARSPHAEAARDLAALKDEVDSLELFDGQGKPLRVPLVRRSSWNRQPIGRVNSRSETRRRN